MKKLLLVSIIAISASFANAQWQQSNVHDGSIIKASAISRKNTSIFRNKETLMKTNYQLERLTSIIKQKKFTIPDKKNTVELKTKSLIQIYDSIYQWKWDTIINEWAIRSK